MIEQPDELGVIEQPDTEIRARVRERIRDGRLPRATDGTSDTEAADWIATAHEMFATPITERGPWFVANLRVCLVKALAALIT